MVAPALAQWQWRLREGCGAIPVCDRQSWCDHAMTSYCGHMPCLCVALPWAQSCPTCPGPRGLPPGSAEHRVLSPGAMASLRGEAGDAVCRALLLGAGVLLAVLSHPALLLAASQA